jgi:hypothetical protein
MSDSEMIDVEPLHLICGNLGTPGAPILSMALMYDNDNGVISGQGLITQSVAPPNGRIALHSISGQVHGLGRGAMTRVMALTGTFQYYLPPPAIGQVTEKFEATIVTGDDWAGHGSFTFGSQRVTNVPVKQRG